MSTTIMLPKFRVNFPNVFEPRLNKLSGKMEYSVVALFPKGTDLSELVKTVQGEVIATWGDKKEKWPKTKEGTSSLKNPVKPQGLEKHEDGTLRNGYEDGAFYVNIKSYERPGLVDQNVKPIIDKSEFYSGCFAIAQVAVAAYNMEVNKGVSLWLQNIQKVADGESLGGRMKAEQAFAPIEMPEGAAMSGSVVGVGAADAMFS